MLCKYTLYSIQFNLHLFTLLLIWIHALLMEIVKFYFGYYILHERGTDIRWCLYALHRDLLALHQKNGKIPANWHLYHRNNAVPFNKCSSYYFSFVKLTFQTPTRFACFQSKCCCDRERQTADDLNSPQWKIEMLNNTTTHKDIWTTLRNGGAMS